ncbi:Uncharacterised protein [uncultured archaeon]|nr:Uncharacterised protein [uncultured archaeon]
MVDVVSYYVGADHFVKIETNLNKRKHRIIVDEDKSDGFSYDVSLVKGKGVLDFFERLRGRKGSDPVSKVPVSSIVSVGKRGRKKKCKGKVCGICGSKMTKLYVHGNMKNQKNWMPVLWYCVHCEGSRGKVS